MTDNEIIANEISCIRRRASGGCNGGTDCNTCDLLMNEAEIIKAYERAMKQNDLINSQKTEIERLSIELTAMREAANSYRAEAERLEDEVNRLRDYCDDYGKFVDEPRIRDEAIKEFADRLCDGRVSNDPVVIAVKVELEMMEAEK